MNRIIIYVSCLLLLVSCDGVRDEISVRFMNNRCAIDLKDTISMAGLDGDSIPLAEIDSLLIETVIDSFPEDFAGKAYFHGKKKIGKLRMYTILLDEGVSRTLHAVIVKDNLPVSKFEIAGNGQSEVYSFSTSTVFLNDTIFVTRKFESLLSDEPSDQEISGDSIVTTNSILKNGIICKISSDTIPVSETFKNPNDEEYTDEVIYYNGVNPTSWRTAGIKDPVAFKNFFMELRNMVKLGNKDEIANYIKYPINGINDEASFVQQYDRVFSNKVRDAILGQKIRQIYRDERGVMIGDDVVWIKQVKGEYKIFSIKQ